MYVKCKQINDTFISFFLPWTGYQVPFVVKYVTIWPSMLYTLPTLCLIYTILTAFENHVVIRHFKHTEIFNSFYGKLLMSIQFRFQKSHFYLPYIYRAPILSLFQSIHSIPYPLYSAKTSKAPFSFKINQPSSSCSLSFWNLFETFCIFSGKTT